MWPRSLETEDSEGPEKVFTFTVGFDVLGSHLGMCLDERHMLTQ